jgi:hypothetical protein
MGPRQPAAGAPALTAERIEHLYRQLVVDGFCADPPSGWEPEIARRAAADGLELAWDERNEQETLCTLVGADGAPLRLLAFVVEALRAEAAMHYQRLLVRERATGLPAATEAHPLLRRPAAEDVREEIDRLARADGLELTWWTDDYGSMHAVLDAPSTDPDARARVRRQVERRIVDRAEAYWRDGLALDRPDGWAWVKSASRPHSQLDGRSIDDVFRQACDRLAAAEGLELEWTAARRGVGDVIRCRAVNPGRADTLRAIEAEVLAHIQGSVAIETVVARAAGQMISPPAAP